MTITPKDIETAYRKVWPGCSECLVEMFTRLMHEAILDQDGSIFTNQTANKAREVFKHITGVELPNSHLEAIKTFDAWMFNHAITNRRPVHRGLLQRLHQEGQDPMKPGDYAANMNGGWDPIMAGKLPTLLIIIRGGEVSEIHSNLGQLAVQVIDCDIHMKNGKTRKALSEKIAAATHNLNRMQL